MRQFRVKLEGECAHLGTVPSGDVARLMLLVEKAAAQAAAVVLRQPKTTTGRYRGPIEQAVHFRLLGIEEGSVVPVLELPGVPIDATETLGFEVPDLGEAALDVLLGAADSPDDPIVAKALLDVADGMHVGDRYSAITFLDVDSPRRVVIDGTARRRLHDYVSAVSEPESRADELVGTLVEADFERRTARLRTPTAPSAGVEVTFTEDQADAIYSALRENSTVHGEVSYDARTHTARSVKLREIVRGVEQLELDPGAFWRSSSLSALAADQGVGQPVDADSLYDTEATDAERDAVMAALAELDS